MKKHLILILFVTIPFLLSCRVTFNGVRGNGIVKTETRNVSPFSKLELSGRYDVEITFSDKTSLQITAEENLMKYIKTKNKNDRLIIYSKKSISPTKDMKIKITTSKLTGVECSGANDIVINDIDTERLEVELSGAGSITITGKAKKFNVEISGAADLEASNLIAEDVDVEISGAANAEVYASKIFNVEASGASSIRLYGNPEDISKEISGISSFRVMNK